MFQMNGVFADSEYWFITSENNLHAIIWEIQAYQNCNNCRIICGFLCLINNNWTILIIDRGKYFLILNWYCSWILYDSVKNIGPYEHACKFIYNSVWKNMKKTDLCEGEVPGMENSGPGPGMEAYLIKQKSPHN